MRTFLYISIMYSKCIECPFHRVVSDPDPSDYFNADDVAIICQKVPKEPDKNSKYNVDRYPFQAIDVALRPYQTKNVTPPSWCPISIQNLRDDKLNDILESF